MLWMVLAGRAQQYPTLASGLGKGYRLPGEVMDSARAVIESNRLIRRMKMDGYWLAQVDTLLVKNDTLKITFYQGNRFDQAIVSLDSAIFMSHELRIKKSRSKASLSNPDRIAEHIEDLINYYENNGYPFVSIKIDSAFILNQIVHINIFIDPGMKINYDFVQVAPKAFISERFASRYFGLMMGEPYSEQDIKTIEDKTQNLPFAELKEVRVSYQLKKAQVALDFTPVKSNSIDGILGMIPREEGGVEFNGEFNLKLNNLFRSGKSLEFYWERLRPETQTLEAAYIHPRLLGSPLDLNLAFDQLKQDTAFSNRSLHVALDYFPKPRLKMKIRYENKLGNQLDDIAEESGDFTINTYGLGLDYQSLDDLKIPTKGLKVHADAGIGNKEIQSSNLPNQSTQYDLRAYLDYYIHTGRRSNLYFNGQAGILINDYLFLNDLYRLGGLRSIRGFNEGEFFASEYLAGRAEWRFFIDEESYLVTFFDQGFISYDILSGQLSDTPAGLGLGMQMNTEGGIFQVLYGLGKRKGEKFSFDSSKIHFGYTAIF